MLGISYRRRLNEGECNEVLLLEVPIGPVPNPTGCLSDLEYREQPKVVNLKKTFKTISLSASVVLWLGRFPKLITLKIIKT